MSEPREWRWQLVPIACALLAYGAVCLGTFVYDDHHSVRDNPAIRSLANLPRFFVDVDLFSSLDNRMYRPVLLVSFALDHAVAGLAPWIYKLTNLLLHAGAAALVYRLAHQLGAERVGALVGSVAFAVHPLASEAVNMVSGRSELLAICAVLGGMSCHLAVLRGNRRAWPGTLACAAVACGSKETGVMLVPLLAVLEGLHGARGGVRWRAAALRLLPVAALVVGYLLVRKSVLGMATLHPPSWTGGLDPRTGAGRDQLTQLATMAATLPGTLLQVLWPAGLTLDPAVRFTDRVISWPVLSGAALLAVLTALGLRRPRRRPAAFAGTAIAWGTALPWVLIPLNVPLSEHRLYGPLAGLALVLAATCPAAALSRRAWPRLAVALVALVFAVLSAERSLAYRDEKVLWERAHAGNPESYRACYSLGVCAMREGRLEDALAWMTRALALYPDYVSAQKNSVELQLQLGKRGDPEAALRQARRLTERAPRNPFHLLLLSRSLAALGQRTGDERLFDEAVAAALRCLEVAAPKGLVYRTAAHARRAQGRLEEALALLDESISRGLDHSSVRLDRHDVLCELGRFDQALRELRAVLAVDPFEPRARQALLRHRGAGAPR